MFKIGGKVKIIDHENPKFIGRTGIITKRGESLIEYPTPRYPNSPKPRKQTWWVRIDEVEEVLCRAEHLRPIKE